MRNVGELLGRRQLGDRRPGARTQQHGSIDMAGGWLRQSFIMSMKFLPFCRNKSLLVNVKRESKVTLQKNVKATHDDLKTRSILRI